MGNIFLSRIATIWKKIVIVVEESDRPVSKRSKWPGNFLYQLIAGFTKDQGVMPHSSHLVYNSTRICAIFAEWTLFVMYYQVHSGRYLFVLAFSMSSTISSASIRSATSASSNTGYVAACARKWSTIFQSRVRRCSVSAHLVVMSSVNLLDRLRPKLAVPFGVSTVLYSFLVNTRAKRSRVVD